MTHDHPILEFDPEKKAVIEPRPYPDAPEYPERAVLCFCNDVIEKLYAEGTLRLIHHFRSAMGKHPVYETELDGTRIVAFHPAIGAPSSSAFLEEAIAHGLRKFIVCGQCGVLDANLARSHVVIPTSAVRDEGTSYHYLPPGREVAPTESAIRAIEGVLGARGVPFTACKTWTTDAFYCETQEKMKRRLAEGCLVVEMEAAALFAVARFRGVELGQILLAGDDLSGECWDARDWHGDASGKERLFWLAAEACARL